jgi:hypothetical protein
MTEAENKKDKMKILIENLGKAEAALKSDKAGQPSSPKAPSGTFMCPECGRTFYTESAMKFHRC